MAEFAGHRDRRRLSYRLEGGNLALHLERRDVLAAAADVIAHPIDKVAVFILAHGITGMDPTIAPGLDSLLRLAVIPF